MWFCKCFFEWTGSQHVRRAHVISLRPPTNVFFVLTEMFFFCFFLALAISARVSWQAGIIRETSKARSESGWNLQLWNNEATHHIKCDINYDTLQRQKLATEGLMLTLKSGQCYTQSNFWVSYIFVEGANTHVLLLLICVYSGGLLIE